MATLVIGVGYIGSALVETLARAGETVIGLDNWFSTPRAPLAALATHPRVHLLTADVTDPAAVDRALDRAPVETVYYLAAQASAHPAAAPPEYTEETNLRGPRLVLEALVRHRVPRFVYASSLRVYGRPLPPVVHEDLPYGRLEDLAHLSKVYAEKLIEMYAWRHGLRARVVRLGLVYGLSPVMKEDPRFMTAPNRFCWQAVRGEPLVVSAEGEWPTGLIAVADAVQALRLAADLAPDEPYLVVNAAPEVATIGEVAQQVADLVAARGGRIPVARPGPPAAGPRPRILSRLDRVGFRATTSLPEGLDAVLAYFYRRPTASTVGR